MEAVYENFSNLDLRVGTVISAAEFPEAKVPAIKLTIDFGAKIGILKSSAQITKHYNLENLPGRQIVAIVNFPKKQIGKFLSDCLVLGAVSEFGVVLLSVDNQVENGTRIG